MKQVYDVVTDFGPFILASEYEGATPTQLDNTNTDCSIITLINPSADVAINWRFWAAKGQGRLTNRRELLGAFYELLGIVSPGNTSLDEYARITQQVPHIQQVRHEHEKKVQQYAMIKRLLGEVDELYLSDELLAEIERLSPDKIILEDGCDNNKRCKMDHAITESLDYNIGITYLDAIITYKSITDEKGMLTISSISPDKNNNIILEVNLRECIGDDLDKYPFTEKMVYRIFHYIISKASDSKSEFSVYQFIRSLSGDNKGISEAMEDFEMAKSLYYQLTQLFPNMERSGSINIYRKNLARFITNFTTT